jgi:hypothetical protein
MVNRVMGREGATQGYKGFPLIAHQMCTGLHSIGENPIRFGLGQILDHRCPNLTGGRTDAYIRRSLHGHKCRCFLGLRLAFASTTGWRIVPIPPRLTADIEPVDLHNTIQSLLAADHQAQGMRQAVGWLTPSASANRMDEMPLSDCSISHRPESQIRKGSFVACRGVRVVTVN